MSVPIIGCTSSSPPQPRPAGYGGNPSLYGMDASCHQSSLGDISGLDFVALRATYGTFQDALYVQHAATVRAAGKFLIAYCFARDEDPGAQALALLTVANYADAWVIDHEQDTTSQTSASQKQTREIVQHVQASQRRCGLYFNSGNYFDAGQDWNWLAWPETSKPPIKSLIYQRRSGAPYGDWSEGSLDDFLGGAGVQSFSVTDDETHTIGVPKGTRLYNLGGTFVRTTSQAQDQPGLVRGELSHSTGHYWVVPVKDQGTKQLLLVNVNDVTDKGKLGNGGGGGGGHSGTYNDGFAAAKSAAIGAVEGI